MTVETKSEIFYIEDICEEWQRRLRLQDWDIEVSIKRYHDLDVQGRCIITQSLKYAEILIRDEADCPNPKSVSYHDTEEILVHEMLHIPFDAVDPDIKGARLIALEQALVAIGRALVALGRIAPKGSCICSGTD